MSARIVDQSALRTNQAFIIALLLVGFVFNLPVLAAFALSHSLASTYTRPIRNQSLPSTFFPEVTPSKICCPLALSPPRYQAQEGYCRL